MQSRITFGRWLFPLSSFLLGSLTTQAQLVISSFDLSTLTFTNAEPGREYRVEYQVNNQPPWIVVTNLQATGQSITVSTPSPNEELVVFRAVWADAPPAQPLGNWTYEGFNENGDLNITGTLSFDSVTPLSAVLDTVGFIPSSGHITGEHNLTGEISGNQINLTRQSYFFFIKGQMVEDEFYGYWSRYSPGISFPVVSPGKWYGGTFRATRSQQELRALIKSE